ncbi:MAG: hypothetical protein WBZ15_23135 [Mycobacterium sp.]
MKSLESMLIGVVAIRSGVLSSFSIDRADVEDDEDDESVAEDARLSKPCGGVPGQSVRVGGLWWGGERGYL